MTQGRLWPLRITRTEPAPYGTADCHLVGVGDDGLPYILKRVADGPLVPASEYICTQLATAIGLAVPEGSVAVLPGESRELCFASRHEGGAMDSIRTLQALFDAGALSRYTPRLMQWFAFDLFTQNVDRHPGNFLFRQSLGKDPALLGIDFSRALLTQGWPHVTPPMDWCNTVQAQRLLGAKALYPATEAAKTMNRLAAVPSSWLETCLQSVPEAWMDAKLRRTVCRWWRHRRPRRLRLLRSHLTHGRYLQLLPRARRP